MMGRASIHAITAAALVGSLWFSATAHAQEDTQTRWLSPFPQLDGGVMALATSGDTLYAGGYFVSAGGMSVNRIAMWDGRRWSSLGSGMNQAVLALALDEQGNLYAAGAFSMAGAEPAANVAVWDGRRWSPLGSGMNSIVNALAVGTDGTLYAGGSFTRAGSAEANYVARWREGRWEPMAGGMDHNVMALAPTTDGRLYAAGGFMEADGKMAHQVALWDGDEWLALGTGLHPPYAARPVYALVLHPNGMLYAGGNFDGAGDTETSFLARWDGRQWSSVGTGVNGGVHALVVDRDGALYAGGYFGRAGDVVARHVARWKSGTWTFLEGGTNDLVHALAVDERGMLHVGGSFEEAGPITASRLACWRPADATAVEVPSQHAYQPQLESAFPNPFDVATTLSFTLAEPRYVTLKIFDALGRQRLTVAEGIRSPGRHEVVVDATDLPSGIYFYVLDAGESVQAGRAIVRR